MALDFDPYDLSVDNALERLAEASHAELLEAQAIENSGKGRVTLLKGIAALLDAAVSGDCEAPEPEPEAAEEEEASDDDDAEEVGGCTVVPCEGGFNVYDDEGNVGSIEEVGSQWHASYPEWNPYSATHGKLSWHPGGVTQPCVYASQEAAVEALVRVAVGVPRS